LVRGIAEATKNADQFARQRRRFAPRPVYVIGDQPDRDIAPAHEVGCRTVLVPSRFKPEWHKDMACVADQVEATFDRAVQWVDRDLSRNCSTPSERVDVG
jgi:putative hydrolase of the HAD superfamily